MHPVNVPYASKLKNLCSGYQSYLLVISHLLVRFVFIFNYYLLLAQLCDLSWDLLSLSLQGSLTISSVWLQGPLSPIPFRTHFGLSFITEEEQNWNFMQSQFFYLFPICGGAGWPGFSQSPAPPHLDSGYIWCNFLWLIVDENNVTIFLIKIFNLFLHGM